MEQEKVKRSGNLTATIRKAAEAVKISNAARPHKRKRKDDNRAREEREIGKQQ